MSADDGSFKAARDGMEAWKTGGAGLPTPKPRVAGVEFPETDALYDDVLTGSEFVVKYGWCDADDIVDTALGAMADRMWETAKAQGKQEGLSEALPQYQAVVAEREQAEIRANGLDAGQMALQNEMREAARLLRIVSEERDVYRAAIERTIGYRVRLWLLTRLAGKTDRIDPK